MNSFTKYKDILIKNDAVDDFKALLYNEEHFDLFDVNIRTIEVDTDVDDFDDSNQPRITVFEIDGQTFMAKWLDSSWSSPRGLDLDKIKPCKKVERTLLVWEFVDE